LLSVFTGLLKPWRITVQLRYRVTKTLGFRLLFLKNASKFRPLRACRLWIPRHICPGLGGLRRDIGHK
jgi:hypothetical protein